MTPPIIIDIEASGFGKHSYPIEVGFVLDHTESWSCLIRPEPEWTHWDANAAAAHGIQRETLFEVGLSVNEVAQQLNDRLLNCTVYTDGWGHDFIWLSLLFETANQIPHFKIDDLRRVLSPKQEVDWEATKLEVQREMATHRHRASMDAQVLQRTWLLTR